MFELLRHTSIVSNFEKEPGFDRLFPNQDFHSGKGMGNLIALPLNGVSIRSGNSCFINLETFKPYLDQWEFLKSVRKVSVDKLREVYQNLFDEKPQERMISHIDPGQPHELEIIIKNQIFLRKVQLSKKLIVFLRDNLNFLNSDYVVKKNLSRSIYKTEKYFKIIEESDEEVMIPRGFSSDMVKFCKNENIPFKVIDRRKKNQEVNFSQK